MLNFANIIEASGSAKPIQSGPNITGAIIDSRKAYPGSVFFAMPGENLDGHDFIEDAFNNGALLAIIQKDINIAFPSYDIRNKTFDFRERIPKFPMCLRVEDTKKSLQSIARFWRQKLDLRVIGITGSVGKSTTKELVAQVLEQKFRVLKTPGNFNNEIGLPMTILSLNENHEIAILEMGLYIPGEIALLCDIAKPHIGVLTIIGTVHAERAGTIEDIAKGKAELVEALPADGVAILNYDDVRVRKMANQTKAKVFFYGTTSSADLWADGVEGLGLEGIHLRLHHKNETIHLRVPLIGRHSAHTVLRAAAVGLVEGLTWQEIVHGLRTMSSQLRLVAVRGRHGATILDDTYNASPESTLSALTLLSEIEGNRIAVLGDMLELGRYEAQGHEMVGIRTAGIVDELITVGELGKLIADSASKAGLKQTAIKSFNSNEEVIEHLESKIGSDDVILIKGSRGLKMEEIVSSLEERQ